MARDQAAPWVAVGSGGIDVGVATRRSWDWFPARRCCLPSYSRRFGSRCSLLRTALLILELLYYGPKLDIFSIEIVTECKSLNPQRDGRREIRMEKSLLNCMSISKPQVLETKTDFRVGSWGWQNLRRRLKLARSCRTSWAAQQENDPSALWLTDPGVEVKDSINTNVQSFAPSLFEAAEFKQEKLRSVSVFYSLRASARQLPAGRSLRSLDGKLDAIVNGVAGNEASLRLCFFLSLELPAGFANGVVGRVYF
nr:transcription factor MYC2-like [Ipomoea batatas]